MKKLIYLILILTVSCKYPIPTDSPDTILWTVAWSPNNKYIATGGNGNQLRLISAKNFHHKKIIEIPQTITKLKWHSDGKHLAICKQISSEPSFILNIETGEEIELEGVEAGENVGGARGIDWNHSGELLALGDMEGFVSIFDKKGKLLKKTKADPKGITGLDWHPFKNILVTVGSQMSIYNLEIEEVKSIQPRPNEVLMLCVEWNPSGEFFVTGDYGDYIQNYPALLQFWTPSGKKIREIEESKAEYRNIRWSSDGKFLATASEAIRIWTKNGILMKKRPFQNLLWGIDWSPDDEKLVVSNNQNELFVLDRNLEILKEIK